jgi:heme/copper-type cytochrome/quinol oxidase subunit 3
MSRKKHLFHLVNVSPWPILISFSGFIFISGIAFYIHDVPLGGLSIFVGLLCVCYCAFFWFNDILDEATSLGYHTKAVQSGLKLGFYLFIISEIMLFFAFFWAYFYSTLSPSIEFYAEVPIPGVYPIRAHEFPLFNTCILVYSGFTVNKAHIYLCRGNVAKSTKYLSLTVFLGFLFVFLQIMEYSESVFNYSDSVYSCSFYMLTGLHGCHVLVGAILLSVCLIRMHRNRILYTNHLCFLFAIWYWHFVDIIWLFLFLFIYIYNCDNYIFLFLKDYIFYFFI